jgi:hypothetical protein
MACICNSSFCFASETGFPFAVAPGLFLAAAAGFFFDVDSVFFFATEPALFFDGETVFAFMISLQNYLHGYFRGNSSEVQEDLSLKTRSSASSAPISDHYLSSCWLFIPGPVIMHP